MKYWVAKVEIPESWISSARIYLNLKTLTGTTAKAVPVARPEAIWVMKLQAARDQDITDLFGMYGTKIQTSEIVNLFQGLVTEGPASRLREAVQKATTTKLFEDSMSKLRMKKMDEKNQKRWQSFGTAVNHIAHGSARTPPGSAPP